MALNRTSRGRPTAYTDELADKICDRLAEGEGLISICRDDGMPNERTLRSWALDDDHPFSPKYARAKEYGYHRLAEEILDIADNGNSEDVQRDKLRVDTRKWMLSKVLPKIYGDKLLAAGPGDNGPIVISWREPGQDDDPMTQEAA